MDAHTIVMGAGFAGLSAADTLTQQGHQVLILEARDRIGGRTRTDHLDDGHWLDIGGQWLGPGQDQLYQLAERFQRQVWPMYVEGQQLLHVGGSARRFRGLIPWRLSPLALLQLGWGFWRLETLARRIPLDAPWSAKGAQRLDQHSLGEWLRRHVRHRHARAILQVALESVLAAHPDEISLLHALFYLHSGGGLERLTASRGGAQQDRIEGGMQGLAEDWAAGLASQGVTLLKEQPVTAVEEDRGTLRVHAGDQHYTARHVICTLPPALTLDVAFRPELPDARRQWCEGMIPGNVIKCFAIYPRPFWREQGLSGSALGDQPPLHVCFDATPPDATNGILMGFIEGREARHWAEQLPEKRQQVVLAAFARFFGEQALAPKRYLDHCWAHETWSRGCYAGVPGPGLVSHLGHSARQPLGRIHWAGTETATHWNGYIEGAIRSGVRAAQEILG